MGDDESNPERREATDPIREALEGMVYQFACRGTGDDGRLALCTAGLSALEDAFDALGWSDPKPYHEAECEAAGCHKEATCGAPTPDGYKRLCGVHYREVRP